MRILATTALALAAATATPALAQDATFDGARAEIVAGWDHAGGQGEGQSGFAYGGAFGFDKQLGRAVIGAETEITGATTEEAGVSAGRDLYVGGRVGFVVGGANLVYGKVEYRYSRYEEVELNRDQVVAGIGIRF